MDLPPPVLPPPVDSGDKTLILLCHLSIFLGLPFVLPLIVWIVRKEDSVLVAAHAKEVLNFHLSFLFYSLACLPLIFVLIGIPLFFLLCILSVIFAIIAAIKASEGGFYFYPLTIRLIT